MLSASDMKKNVTPNVPPAKNFQQLGIPDPDHFGDEDPKCFSKLYDENLFTANHISRCKKKYFCFLLKCKYCFI